MLNCLAVRNNSCIFAAQLLYDALSCVVMAVVGSTLSVRKESGSKEDTDNRTVITNPTDDTNIKTVNDNINIEESASKQSSNKKKEKRMNGAIVMFILVGCLAIAMLLYFQYEDKKKMITRR